MGTGRSGTTLLDIILGNATEIMSAGELNRFTKRNGIPHSARDGNVEDFWSFVKENLNSAGFEDPVYYFDEFKKFEYHQRASLLIKDIEKNKNFKTYTEFQQVLFTSIFKKAAADQGKSIIIDSSKYPLRGYSLSKIFGDQISFIHIKRCPNEVVHSFQKKGVEQPAKKRFYAHLYLMWINLLSISVMRMLHKKHKTTTVVYDNLINEPLTTLVKIEKDLGVDLSVPKDLVAKKHNLAVGPLFDGNRLRLQRSIVLKKKNAEPQGNFFDRLLFPLHRLVWYGKNKVC